MSQLVVLDVPPILGMCERSYDHTDYSFWLLYTVCALLMDTTVLVLFAITELMSALLYVFPNLEYVKGVGVKLTDFPPL